MIPKAKLFGLEKLVEKLGDKGWAASPIAELLDRWRLTVERESKRRVRVWRGHLRRSITSERDDRSLPLWAKVGTNVPYAEAVHEGQKPHFPPIDAITPWANAHGIPPFLVARKIALHGTEPNPFLREAADEALRSLPAWMQDTASLIEERSREG